MVSGPRFGQDAADEDDVELYSTVRVQDADGEEEYTIVCAPDALGRSRAHLHGVARGAGTSRTPAR